MDMTEKEYVDFLRYENQRSPRFWLACDIARHIEGESEESRKKREEEASRRTKARADVLKADWDRYWKEMNYRRWQRARQQEQQAARVAQGLERIPWQWESTKGQESFFSGRVPGLRTIGAPPEIKTFTEAIALYDTEMDKQLQEIQERMAMQRYRQTVVVTRDMPLFTAIVFLATTGVYFRRSIAQGVRWVLRRFRV